MNKEEALRHYFGYASFRPGQADIVDCLLSGQDVLAVMPTGAGKSICFQLPALLLGGVTLVISPLISLMKDQVSALTQNGIPAAYLNGSLTERQIAVVLRRAARGSYRLIYVAPERLGTPAFRTVATGLPISMVCVDEAHCVSQWGHDFRPAYLQIAPFLDALKKRPTLCAFTATATPQVRDDIVRLLGLRQPQRFVTGFDRENLFFSVVHPADKLTELQKYLDLFHGKSGIVYCTSRKSVDQLFAVLKEAGVSVARYHAGMEAKERRVQQERFVQDAARVMIATNAFGMGIDKPNVSFVIHYQLPGDLESYYQEAGRAGRDGSPADCVLFFNAQDVQIQTYFIEHPEPNDALTAKELLQLQKQRQARLTKMISYADGTRCLRASLLRYFGETPKERCGACSVCCGEIRVEDITVPCQKILSCVARMKAAAKEEALLCVLRGERTPFVLKNGFETLSTFGILSSTPPETVRDWLQTLLAQGFLTKDDSGTLRLCAEARAVLFAGQRVRRRAQTAPKTKRGRTVPLPDPVLLQQLEALCRLCAKRSGVPPFAVFTLRTLSVMAAVQPETVQEFSEIPGVSSAKIERYGAAFLREIKRYKTLEAENL